MFLGKKQLSLALQHCVDRDISVVLVGQEVRLQLKISGKK